MMLHQHTQPGMWMYADFNKTEVIEKRSADHRRTHNQKKNILIYYQGVIFNIIIKNNIGDLVCLWLSLEPLRCKRSGAHMASGRHRRGSRFGGWGGGRASNTIHMPWRGLAQQQWQQQLRRHLGRLRQQG